MIIKPSRLDYLIHSDKNRVLHNLDYFKSLLSNVLLLNNLGILKGNEKFNEIIEFVDPDDMFGNKKINYQDYEYYQERLHSNIYLDKETNQLYQEILKLPLEEFIDEDEFKINELSKVKIEELRLEHYNDSVLNILISYTSTLDKISFEYDLKNIEKNIINGKSILNDSKISLYSPLLFTHEQWEKVILNELMISNSLEEVEQKKRGFLENLDELEALLPYGINLPLIAVNEGFYWLANWYEKNTLFIYPLHFWFSSKKHFLESLGKNKLKRLFDKELVKKYNEAKKTVLKLKGQLRRNKIEVKQEKYLTSITQGMAYLLSRENSTFSKEELYDISEKLIDNLFYSNSKEPEENIIKPSVKINNVLLLEYIFFLQNKKKYLKKKKVSIPLIISDNLNYNSKGFKYSTLNKIYNDIKKKKEFSFSVISLSKMMKMRNY